MIDSESLLITGGTGSFGRKFTEVVLKKFPSIKRITIYSRDEYKQFNMANMPQFADSRIKYYIGDVRDKDRLYSAFRGVDTVIHSAALKHVPLCEQNPTEAIKTNVMGAQNVIEVARERGVKKVIALSTDKACSPINLYGATKLCSDKLFIAANTSAGATSTKFSVVRYGNVAGSRGSVIPFFKKLIEQSAKELPITDVRMTRFWLNLEQAVDMVITALDTMVGRELFVRKIPSMKMVELAKAMAPNLPIKVIGIRPGEKIHEMMISAEDSKSTVDAGNYFIIMPHEDEIKSLSLKNLKRLEDGFEYSSGNNTDWLSIEQMRDLLGKIDPAYS